MARGLAIMAFTAEGKTTDWKREAPEIVVVVVSFSTEKFVVSAEEGV